MEHEQKPVEIQDLNKTQLILLAILISFVVSIATGIVTVTLMQQAPTGVTQTINRVVQQTIEKVVPDYVPGQTQTVVVKEDDLVVDAVAKARAGTFPITDPADATAALPDMYSVGGGVFIAESATLDASHTYSTKIGDASVDIKVTATSPLGFSLLAVSDPKANVKDLPKIAFGRDADVQPGQTAVIVSSASVTKAVVQSVSPSNDTDAAVNSIQVAPVPGAALDGTLAVDLDGNAIGLVLKGSDGAYGITDIDAIAKFITNPAPPTPQTPPAAN